MLSEVPLFMRCCETCSGLKCNRYFAPTLSSVLDLCMEMDRAAYLGHACPVVLM